MEDSLYLHWMYLQMFFSNRPFDRSTLWPFLFLIVSNCFPIFSYLFINVLCFFIFQVPARWMAIESIAEKKYSHASDVWSFGVLCWEVFSWGQVPYAGL